MQMFIFTNPSPRRDGDLDAEVVFHEHTHGLSWRLVGGGQALGDMQSDGMGEGWSDFYGLSLLSQSGDDVNGIYAAGGYASYKIGGTSDTQNYYFGIRRYPYTTDMSKNPLTFKDIDPAQADYCSSGAPYHTGMFGTCSAASANEVHNEGEVWCVTLWDARANLVNKYGWAIGNQLMLQLATDGMKLTPPHPNFLQARDAIIQADLVDTGGANRNDLWVAFARRGMGFSATSPASSTTTGIHESFDLPDDLRISPLAGMISSGPVGGPFSPTSQSLTLTNAGTNSLTWSLANTNGWLNLSPSGGTLTPGGASASVLASLTGTANTLPMGIYAGTVSFSNLTSGVQQSRQFNLYVGQPNDWFTELFSTTTINSLAFTTYTFTPDGSANFYNICKQSATVFPTDPTGGTALTLTDDSYTPITLSGGNTVAIYRNRTNVLYVGSNGYLTMNGGDTSYIPSYASHFAYLRVAPLYRDLNPGAGGSITWKQLSDRVAVTYQNVPIYGSSTQINSFQIEMFFDGRIRLTYLSLNASSGLVGLSAGAGQPANFAASDFTSYGPCVPQPPVIVLQPASQTIPTGANVTFSVSASGTTPLSYFWQRNGVLIAGANNSSYTVGNVQLADSGSQFSCVVSNAYGITNSLAATLTVLALPPSITQQPANQAVLVGGTASFSVTATGSLPLNYFWMRNGAFIAGATNSTYTTNNVQLTDSGAQFSCVVSNAYGTTNSQSATLLVSGLAPSITLQPQSQTASVGGAASFTISANGTAPLSYYWRRNGTAISGATNSTYNTSNVQLADSGAQFSCLVSNAFGTILSSSATLTVMVGPVFLTGNYLYLPIQTNGVFLAANTGAKYNSAGTGGAAGVDFWQPGVPVYNWMIGVAGVNHLNGSSPVVGGFVSLTVSNLSSGGLQRAVISGVVVPGLNFTRDISFATNSKVICIVDTLQNTGVTALANVVSLDTADPDQDSVSASTSSTLNDVVSVNSSNDMVVATGPSSGLSVGFGSESGIQIPGAVGFNNTNVYSFTNVVDPNGASADVDINLAQNYGTLAAGQSRTVVWYTIFGNSKMEVTNAFTNLGSSAPVITSQPAGITVAVGNNATFTVGVTGTTPLSYFWRRNGSFIPGANAASYTFTNAQIADSGSQFSCVITNVLGTATSSAASLKVETIAANDQCIGALVISGMTYTNAQYTTNATSTGDPVPSCVSGFGNGVWYQFTPAYNGQVVVDTFGSDFDTGLALYSGSCGALTEVACNDDAGGLNSQIAASVSAGTTYYLLAGGYSGYTGHLLLHLSLTAPPVIVSQPTNQNLTVGYTASFSVGATGGTPLSCFWMRNSAMIPGATNSTYAITNVQLTDSGSQFSCVVSNAYGITNSQTATLMVRVDHFVWSAIGSPQLVNLVFGATITAQDVNNQTVTNFTGTLALSGTADGGLTTNTILGSPTYTTTYSGDYTLGYAFTPNTNMTVTHVRHTFGTKVSIWTDGGALLATQAVTSVPGTWVETPLTTPLTLTAGVRYRVAAYTASGSYYFRTDMTNTFPNGTINQGCEVSGDSFPANSDSVFCWFVDLRYTVGSAGAIVMTPTNTGNFTGGVWTGDVTVLQAASNVVLLASDGLGEFSSSNPFQVISNTFVSAQMTVHTDGNGTVSPNYQGAWLPIGQTYSMTAMPSPGYVFFRWTGSQATNSPVLNFVMASNLTFTAHFANLTNPLVGLDRGSSNQLVISWPVGVGNFGMQTNSKLGTTNWGDYNGAAITTNGTVRQIIVNPGNRSLFFRLKR
jgi:uncharacterized repeat protein (TIGR02543 family)